MRQTRLSKQTGIFYRHVRDLGWQHIDFNDKIIRPVGPWYKTKTELLTNHFYYLTKAGWIRGL